MKLGEAWAGAWRLAFNGLRGQRQFKGYAALLVDKARAWGEATVLRGFPSFGDRDALSLLSGDRVLEIDPAATDTVRAELLLAAPTIWRWCGTPTGLLTALHIAGFPQATTVQQNGLAFTIGETPNLANLETRGALPTWITRTELPPGNPAIPASTDGRPAIPVGTVSWWNFDDDMDGDGNQHANRIAVLFPSDVPAPDLGDAAVLARICRVIRAWRPADAHCVYIAVIAGTCWDWEPGNWDDDPGDTWDASATTFYAAE